MSLFSSTVNSVVVLKRHCWSWSARDLTLLNISTLSSVFVTKSTMACLASLIWDMGKRSSINSQRLRLRKDWLSPAKMFVISLWVTEYLPTSSRDKPIFPEYFCVLFFSFRFSSGILVRVANLSVTVLYDDIAIIISPEHNIYSPAHNT